MSKSFLFLLIFIAAIFAAACGGVPANSTLNANTNANAAIKVDQSNMPAGLSNSPAAPPANLAPGIPANATPLAKGPTPTPGIPSEKELKKPFKPGPTPTPGIPNADEIRKALGTKPTMASPASNSNSSMMMMKKKPSPQP